MIEMELFDRAQVVLRHSALINAGDQVLIVSDGTVSNRILDAFAMAAHSDNAKVCRVTYNPQLYIPMKRYCLFAGVSLRLSLAEPPAPVSAALRAADIIVVLTSDMTLTFSSAYQEALSRGKRIISSAYLTEENMLFLFPESAQEVLELDELTRAMGRAFEATGKVRFTSPAGTDFECSFGQYQPRCDGGTVRKLFPSAAKRTLIPGGQVDRVPDDGSVRGCIVLDRSIAAREYRELFGPIKLEIEKGYVREISGGWEAHDLRRFLEELGGGEIYHVTEMAVGTNKRCIRCGVAAPAEDTHAAGCVTIALGCDVHLGGSVRAPAHIDCTTHRGTLQIGGMNIVSDGKILV